MFKLLYVAILVLLCLDLAFAVPLAALEPRRNRQSTSTGKKNNSNRVPATGSGPATATDGSTILEDEVVINGFNLRFKVSAPATQLVSNSQANQGNANNLGINILFHGDGGQSFFDFPNQGVNNGLMGIALLAPDSNLRWGGLDPNDRTGLVRPDGVAHSAVVNQFITKVLPTIVNFNTNSIFLEGVSGGSLLLSGFFIPQFASSLGIPGAILGCGGLEPQVNVRGDLSNLRLHFQSTVDELANLQQSIPVALQAYENLVDSNRLSADASPNGGHCEFDEVGFVSGVQLLTDNFADILRGRGTLNGVAVANLVSAGNEDIFN